MTPALSLPVPAAPVPRWRRYVWRHPEWWSLLISAACAAALIALMLPHAGHHHRGQPAWTHWALMIPAMMWPLLAGHVRHTASRSFWNRRHRAAACFLAGYTVIWLAPAPAVTALVPALPAWAWLAVAALWQFTPWKAAAMLACHRTEPLAPHGWQADAAALRYGARQGWACLLACGPMMLACIATHCWLWAMPLFFVAGWLEREAPHPGRALRHRLAFALATAGFAVFLLE